MDENQKDSLIMLLILALVAGIFLFPMESARETGLYQHIRRAQKYFEKGKYEKGILYLHKAYEEMPSSANIRENLTYGYISYGRFLAEKGEYDKAVEYLSMAYEIDPGNEVLVNDLALAYCRRGMDTLKKGDAGTAAEDISRGSAMALNSKKARTNISNYLFNKAVEAFASGDSAKFLLAANASYMLRSRFETLDLFGEYYYKSGDLEKALFYWQKAVAKKPGDMSMKTKITKAKKEIALKTRMQEITLPNFNVGLYRNYSFDMDKLGRILGSIYRQVGNDLGYYPPTGTSIIFYNERDFYDIFGQKGIARAFYDGKIRMLVTAEFNEPAFPAVIAHEYTHALVSILTDNMCPAWLHEGLAMYEQANYLAVSVTRVKNFMDSNGRMTITLLEEAFEPASNARDLEKLALAYEGAYTAVKFIIDKWGWAGARGLLKRLKEGRHYVNAIDEEFYITVRMFEDMWNDYLKERLG